MGSGNDAHIDILRLVAANPLEGTLLQHTQQLDLHRQRHIADLVEEQRAAIGQLEAPGAAGNGTGKGTLLMAEQFTFQQLSWNSTTVDRHKRAFAALGVIVQVTRHHFLASTGLAQDQHTGIGIGDLLHHLPNLPDSPTGADQAAEQIGFALPATLARLVVHLAINLSAVQRIQ